MEREHDQEEGRGSLGQRGIYSRPHQGAPSCKGSGQVDAGPELPGLRGVISHRSCHSRDRRRRVCLATGATIGGVVGLPLALFTFGLSIPVSATIGGACGFVTGAAAGGTVGGATGYRLYKRRDQIAAAWKSGRQELTRIANEARKYACERVSAVRSKFAGGSA